MKSVLQILKSKPDQALYSIAPTASVFDAAALMARQNIGALLVLEEGRVAGILTERDITRKMTLADRMPAQVAVRELMHAPVICVHPRHTNEECMGLMTQMRLRHLPVVDDGGALIGLVSIGDLVKDTISEQEFTIHQLERYIAGDRG